MRKPRRDWLVIAALALAVVLSGAAGAYAATRAVLENACLVVIAKPMVN